MLPLKSTSVLVRAALVLATLAASGIVSAQQEPTMTATVRGRVTIGVPVSTRRPTNTYSRTVQAANLAPATEVRNVVVYMKDAPRARVAPTHAEIRQLNETFIPRAVAVTVGSEVSFPNADPFYHNVFSLSRPRTFDLGRYPTGQTRTVRFDKPGLVKVFCQIHSHMSASIMIFDHPWFAVPDAEGRFTLTDLPAGTHRLVAWHERLGETGVDIRLSGGETTAMDFVLPVPKQ